MAEPGDVKSDISVIASGGTSWCPIHGTTCPRGEICDLNICEFLCTAGKWITAHRYCRVQIEREGCIVRMEKTVSEQVKIK